MANVLCHTIIGTVIIGILYVIRIISVSTSYGFQWLTMVYTKCSYDRAGKLPNFKPVKIKIKLPSNVPRSVTIQTN